MKKERIIEVQPVKIEQATVLIEGDGDLVLNKMNARTVRELTAARDGKRPSRKFPTFGRILSRQFTGGTATP